MNQYAAKLNFGYPRMTTWLLIEADSYEEAYQIAYEETVEWASSFGFYQDDEMFAYLDTVGYGWDEEEQEFSQTGSIAPLVELYDPEKHDGYLR